MWLQWLWRENYNRDRCIWFICWKDPNIKYLKHQFLLLHLLYLVWLKQTFIWAKRCWIYIGAMHPSDPLQRQKANKWPRISWVHKFLRLQIDKYEWRVLNHFQERTCSAHFLWFQPVRQYSDDLWHRSRPVFDWSNALHVSSRLKLEAILEVLEMLDINQLRNKAGDVQLPHVS